VAYNKLDGHFYITGSEVIRKVSPQGVTTVFAGAPNVQGTQDGYSSQARFFHPNGITIDESTGDIYIAEFYRIRKITKYGNVSVLAGASDYKVQESVFTTQYGAAAQFSQLRGIVLSPVENCFYVADQRNHAIRRITPDGTVTTLAGGKQGSNPPSAEVPLSAAMFNRPSGLAVASNGDLYVADYENNSIRKISHSSGTVSTVAGGNGASIVDGPKDKAGLWSPIGVALDPYANLLYVAENGTTFQGGYTRIRKVSLATGEISTVKWLSHDKSRLVSDIHVRSIAIDMDSKTFVVGTKNALYKLEGVIVY
jgi:sugar lactone lactonase YvrE